MALMPSNVSFSQAAAITLGALTTLVALTDLGRLSTGMSLLINGAAGGLGIQGIQIAKLFGAHVTAIAGNLQAEFCNHMARIRFMTITKLALVTLAILLM